MRFNFCARFCQCLNRTKEMNTQRETVLGNGNEIEMIYIKKKCQYFSYTDHSAGVSRQIAC